MGETKNSKGCHITCCNSPKTACLIIGTVQMVISFLLLVGGSVLIGWFNDEMGPPPDVPMLLIGGLVLAEGAVLLVTSTILIQGTRKGRPNYLLCWMIIFGLSMVLTAIGVLTMMVQQTMFRFYLNDMFVLASVIVAIVLGISTYLVAIVNSHRDQLLNGSETEKEEDCSRLTPNSTSKTACLVIGVAYLVISILALIILGSLDLIFYWLSPPYSYYYSWIRGLTIAGLAVQIAISAILIHGTRKGRPGYLLFWMIIFGFSIVLTAIGVLIMADYSYIEFMFESTFISVSIILISSAYLVTIVNSHMRQLHISSEIEKKENWSRLTPNSTSKTAALIIGVVLMVISIVTLVVLCCIDISWLFSDISHYSLIRGLTIAGPTVQIAISAILIQGTIKGKSGYLLCWIVMFGICTGTAAIGALTYQSIQVAIAVQHAYIPQWVITEMIMTCVIVAIVVGFFSFLMVMVNSHRKELLTQSQDMDTEGNTKPNQEMENKTYNKMYLENIKLVIEKVIEKLDMII